MHVLNNCLFQDEPGNQRVRGGKIYIKFHLFLPRYLPEFLSHTYKYRIGI